MKTRIVILLALLALLLVASTAQAGRPAAPGPLYAAVPGTMAGGNYRLSSATWQVQGTAGGAGYALAQSILQGAGCCCTFLPCTLRNSSR